MGGGWYGVSSRWYERGYISWEKGWCGRLDEVSTSTTERSLCVYRSLPTNIPTSKISPPSSFAKCFLQKALCLYPLSGHLICSELRIIWILHGHDGGYPLCTPSGGGQKYVVGCIACVRSGPTMESYSIARLNAQPPLALSTTGWVYFSRVRDTTLVTSICISHTTTLQKHARQQVCQGICVMIYGDYITSILYKSSRAGILHAAHQSKPSKMLSK